jgi:hypothetical protein
VCSGPFGALIDSLLKNAREDHQLASSLTRRWPGMGSSAGRESPSLNRQEELTLRIQERLAAAATHVWEADMVIAPRDSFPPVQKDLALTPLRSECDPERSNTMPKKQKGQNRKPKKTKPAIHVREGSKKAEIIELLRRRTGVTLQELMTATGWQAHSVRGFLSAAVGKQMGLHLDSSKREDGQRVYRIG